MVWRQHHHQVPCSLRRPFQLPEPKLPEQQLPEQPEQQPKLPEQPWAKYIPPHRRQPADNTKPSSVDCCCALLILVEMCVVLLNTTPYTYTCTFSLFLLEMGLLSVILWFVIELGTHLKQKSHAGWTVVKHYFLEHNGVTK
jgi:hypothetical protein